MRRASLPLAAAALTLFGALALRAPEALAQSAEAPVLRPLTPSRAERFAAAERRARAVAITLSVTSFGFTGLGLAFGIAGLVLRENAAVQFNAQCDAGLARAAYSMPCRELLDTGDRNVGLAAGGFSMAALFFAAGVATAVVAGPFERRAARVTRFGCAPFATGGLWCAGSF